MQCAQSLEDPAQPMKRFSSFLIANRGEIALKPLDATALTQDDPRPTMTA